MTVTDSQKKEKKSVTVTDSKTKSVTVTYSKIQNVTVTNPKTTDSSMKSLWVLVTKKGLG